MELSPVELRLADVVGDAVRGLIVPARDKGLQLKIAIDSDVPSRVVADPLRIQQVLVNLVSNALKFTAQGWVRLEVSSSPIRHRGANITFRVVDSGIGIPSDKQNSIFKSFEQADGSTTRRYGGTGLGLAISSELVRMMGGELAVDSVPDQGSTFWFEIPVQVVEEELPAPRRPGFENLRLLIVEPNPETRDAMTSLLQPWQVDSAVADSLESAIAVFRWSAKKSRRFTAVIVDRATLDEAPPGMPARLDDEEGLRLVIVDELGDREDRSTPACAIDALTKPVSSSDLLDLLTRLTEGGDVEDSAKTANVATRGGRKLLLAEDIEENQILAVEILEGHGYEIVVASNGREAVEMASNEQFDAILLDVQMPELSGIEATEEIRARETSGGGFTPIVALTAHAMAGDRERFLAAGMQAHVSKPFRRDDLLAALETVCSGELVAS